MKIAMIFFAALTLASCNRRAVCGDCNSNIAPIAYSDSLIAMIDTLFLDYKGLSIGVQNRGGLHIFAYDHRDPVAQIKAFNYKRCSPESLVLKRNNQPSSAFMEISPVSFHKLLVKMEKNNLIGISVSDSLIYLHTTFCDSSYQDLQKAGSYYDNFYNIIERDFVSNGVPSRYYQLCYIYCSDVKKLEKVMGTYRKKRCSVRRVNSHLLSYRTLTSYKCLGQLTE